MCHNIFILNTMLVCSPRALCASPSQQWEECYLITLGKEEEKDSRIKASALNSLGGFCVFATESMALKTLCFNRKCQMFEQQRKRILFLASNTKNWSISDSAEGRREPRFQFPKLAESTWVLEGRQLQPPTGRQVSSAGRRPGPLLPSHRHVCKVDTPEDSQVVWYPVSQGTAQS